MGTVVCLPTAGRVCAQCFPHSKKNSITSASCQQVPEEENTVLLRQVATAVMSECNEKTKGGGAEDEDATGPDACAQHSPSFLQRTFSTSGSGSGCSSGCGSGGGGASGASGFGFGSRVTLFNSQLFVSAVSSASTATAHLLEGFQKKRTRVKKKDHMEQQQPQQQQQQQQEQQQHEEQVKGDGEREQGSLTIVRRSSTKKGAPSASPGPPSPSALTDDEALDNVDLSTENLPAVDTPDACDKAAIRLRCLLRQLERGEISAEILQKNLHYAARVLEAVFIDETKRLADEDDELSEVQPDAVPPEVREWLASTFTRQLATTRRKADEKPKFRSVAHAIRAGIFVDRIYRRVSNTALMQFPPEVVRVLKTLDEWSFDVFALSEAASSQPVKYLGYDLLNRYGMIHKFKVPPVTLETFLTRIEEGYCRHKNPYHNNLHAADVAQTVHYMLCQTGLMNWLTDLEIFATLVAALVHDYEHTGTTNNFHVMSGTETALLYNDRAVLENHHISASFRVLKEDDCNILLNLSREEYREFRTLVIDMVLATDMSFHFSQLKNMRNLLTLAEPSVDKSKALSLVLHCCDISHPAKRWDLHHRWTMLLLEEFFRQGDMERDLGLPFSPLCDRNNTLVAESQIGFIEFIVEPSMAVCSDMLEAVLGPIHSSCKPGEAVQESISEEAELDRAKNGDASPQRNTPKYKIKKPWSSCLAENKKIWKEQAAKDAELRAQQQQAEASGTEE